MSSSLERQLVEAFQQTIEMLQAIVGAHERFYTTSHSVFVGEKSAQVAERLGLSAEEVFITRIAGYLHDIGKIGLPDRIIGKSTRSMTDQELALYRSHPVLGHRILSHHKGFTEIATAVLHHHERLDGSGFPQGLSGKLIHPAALIIGVVDIYHNAVYKQSRDRTEVAKSSTPYFSTQSLLDYTRQRSEQALQYLQSKAGSTFSEKVVDTFIALIEEERRKLGQKVIRRLSVAQLQPGMQLAENCYTSYGLLIVGSNEPLTPSMIERLKAFAEAGEIPMKLLVIV